MLKEPRFLIGGLFFGVGMLFATVGYYNIFHNYILSKSYINVPGKVSSIRSCSGSGYRAIVAFKDLAGGDHETTSDGCVSMNGGAPWRRGQAMTVLYPEGNPEMAILKTGLFEWSFYGIFALLGTTHSSLGFYILFCAIQKMLRTRAIRETGLPLIGHVVGSRVNESIRVNGQCPFQIEYQYTDQYGGIHRAWSDDIWFDPIGTGVLTIGTSVHVFVSRQNPRDSIADLTAIQKLAA